MLLNLLLLAVVLVCLVIMAVILARKFPQLTLIETESLPKEQNLIRKRQIIDERLQRTVRGLGGGVWGLLRPFGLRVRDVFRRLVHQLTVMDRRFRSESQSSPERRENQVRRLQKAAEQLTERELYGEAEKKLIEALSFDEMNEDVYRDLGDLYLRTRKWDQARETYAFLVRILVIRLCGQTVSEARGVPVPRWESFSEGCQAGAPEHAEIARQFANFSRACSEAGDWSAAKSGLETALSFEPANPRHLDSLVEACIMDGDRERAVSALERLRQVNPDNQKLESLGERIAALSVRDETKVSGQELDK